MMLNFTIIFLPLMILGFGLVHQGHRIFITFLAVSVVGSLIKAREVRYFCFMVTVSCIAAQLLFMLGIKGRLFSANAVSAAVFVMIGMIVYIAAANSKESYKILIFELTVADFICISAVIQSILGIFQTFGFDPWAMFLGMFFKMNHKLSMTTQTGSLGNPNFLASYLVISLPFFCRSKKLMIIGGLISIQIMFMATSGAVIAGVIGMSFYFKKAKYVLIIFAAGVLFLMFGENGNSTTIWKSNRYEWWILSLKSIFSGWKPFLLGHGPLMRITKFPIHNEWISVFYQYGIGSVVLALSYIVRMRNQDRILFSALIIAAVNCLANYTLHLPPSGVLVMVIMGLLERNKHGGLSIVCRPYGRS